MTKPIIHVAVTGGAGQIAYSLLFRIAAGELFGRDQPLVLSILEIPDALKVLEGVKMELDDCAFPLLREIRIGSDPLELFKGVHYAILVGSKPRGPGMERAELLNENAKIFVAQGAALNKVADRKVKVFVVGNPCNTNCLIAMQNAPDLPKENFFAMTRLDENRAIAQLAQKANVRVEEVTCVGIWGNHSATQVPDFVNAKISNKPVVDVIKDKAWLEGEFIASVQKRGAAIIAARGKSSAASAASAVIDGLRSLIFGTGKDNWFSMCRISDGNPYGIQKGLIFSFPCRLDDQGNCQIVSNLPLNDFLKQKIAITEKELLEERELALGEASVRGS